VKIAAQPCIDSIFRRIKLMTRGARNHSHGFDAVRVADIAMACGVSEKTVFNYFPTKESLVLDRLEITMASRHGRGKTIGCRCPGRARPQSAVLPVGAGDLPGPGRCATNLDNNTI
jgi:Bacterial regulatory proteins, tetR family